MSRFENHFVNASFKRAILNIAAAHGDFPMFWLQNLNGNHNPDATWRSLLVLGCLGFPQFAQLTRPYLNADDSRVRAWACFACGQLRDEESLDELQMLQSDPAARVRVHACQAISAIRGVHAQTHKGPHHKHNNNLILISDDAINIQNKLSGSLAMMGFHVATASSEEETLIKARELKPSAIITDNQKGFDNLSGLNMTWDICRDRDLRETQIFMLTADHIEPVFLWQGGDYYLAKSCEPLEEIVAVVSDFLA